MVDGHQNHPDWEPDYSTYLGHVPEEDLVQKERAETEVYHFEITSSNSVCFKVVETQLGVRSGRGCLSYVRLVINGIPELAQYWSDSRCRELAQIWISCKLEPNLSPNQLRVHIRKTRPNALGQTWITSGPLISCQNTAEHADTQPKLA